MKKNIIKINNTCFDLTNHLEFCEKDSRYYKRKNKYEKTIYVEPEFMYLQKLEAFKSWNFIESSSVQGEYDVEFGQLIANEFNTSSLLNCREIPHLNEYKMFNLPCSLMTKLMDRISTALYIKGDISNSLVEEIIDEINEIGNMIDVMLKSGPIFMKGEYTSGKNVYSMVPVKTKKDVILRMASWYKEFSVCDKQTFTFFTCPWIEVDRTKEFRVFVYKKKIVTICPQLYFEVYKDEIDHELLFEKLYEIENTFVDKFIHHNYSMDLYWDNGSFKLIELNQWFNSHPGLFTYTEIKASSENKMTTFKFLSDK